MTDTQLNDLGERRLVAEILAPRYETKVSRFGDDAASIELPPPGNHLLASTDPCPPPMSRALGFDDYFYDGWLLATINLSDLAAAGAKPLALLTSLQLPADMTLVAFERLLDGIDACAASHGAQVVGGNLKEAKAVDLSAVALGVCDSAPLSRSGARPGDAVVVLGDLGDFWAATLSIKRGLRDKSPDDPLFRNLLNPRAKTGCGLELRRHNLLTSCIDNSDGLQPSLRQLGEASSVAIHIDRDQFSFAEEVRRAAAGLDVDPLRLALGWGDWQLIGTCRNQDLAKARECAERTATGFHVIGVVEEGQGVFLRDGEGGGLLLPLESERFSKESWFTAGIDSYVGKMLEDPLRQ